MIPKPMRVVLGLDAGAMVEIVLDDGHLVLRPVGARSALDALVGMFADGPDLIAALEADHRWEIERDERRRS
ncbi:MAG: AbrB/MazE/SpoVT family DNA-binding domain-containing protein [Anaerolineae bacterium]